MAVTRTRTFPEGGTSATETWVAVGFVQVFSVEVGPAASGRYSSTTVAVPASFQTVTMAVDAPRTENHPAAHVPPPVAGHVDVPGPVIPAAVSMSVAADAGAASKTRRTARKRHFVIFI
jgi:hypothetical protein